MRDEASLARLEEMGFSVYVPRATRSAPVVPAPAKALAASSASRAGVRARVVLLARDDTPAARALLANVRRALAFARIDSEVASAVEAGRIGDAKGLVAFGDAFVREAGVALPASRQAGLAWVATDDAAAIAGQPRAKRALWSELKRITRTLRAGPA
jgi:hypothetical protein